ncbi:MAG: hypothetical protein IKU19_01100, partial [Clostridia bacterium]|nr:hypothetical protein [Clostridia bacterium]
FFALLEKNSISEVKIKTEYKGKITAPVKKGDKVGRVVYYLGDKEVGESDIVAREDVRDVGFKDIFLRLLQSYFLQ